jgi:para-nitrobenzyl esterase
MTRSRIGLLTIAFLLAGCGDDDAPSSDTPQIQPGTLIRLAAGQLQGDTDGGTRRFRGIRYAKAPVGSLRWRPAQAVDEWQSVLPATEFGSACAQPSWIQGPESLEEDCLFLNVWTPEPAPSAPLPVMVWLPGGGNQNGSASDASPLSGGATIYDGRDLAESQDVIVVTLNYRVGVMGFFSHPSLVAEGSTSGNQGLGDQQLALKWVRDNILAFGGDPRKVTLFGESAGSQDTCLQLVAPGARGLFHRAISQSGGCTTFRKLRADAESQAAAFAQAVGCAGTADELECLRGKPVKDLLIPAPADGGTPGAPGGNQFSGSVARWDFNPVLDGEIIPDQPRALIESGNFAKVPYLLGSNFEEGRLFMLAAAAITTEAEYMAALERLFKEAAASVAAQYPLSAFAMPQDALVRIWGDYRLGCSTYDSGRRVTAQGVNTYHYAFARAIPGLEGLGPTHGVEMPYVFGTLPETAAGDAALSDSMQGYWARFVKTGDPNGDGAPAWPAFDEASDKQMKFDEQSSVVTGYRRAECDFWRTIYDAAFR